MTVRLLYEQVAELEMIVRFDSVQEVELIVKSFGKTTRSSEFWMREWEGWKLTCTLVMAAISELSALIVNELTVPKFAMY